MFIKMINYNQDEMNACEESKGAIKGVGIFFIILLFIIMCIFVFLILKRPKINVDFVVPAYVAV
jgi:hypothetical protein